MQPSQLLKDYETNKKDSISSLIENNKSFNNGTPYNYINQEIHAQKPAVETKVAKNIIGNIGSLTITSISFLLANKFGVANISNNLLVTASLSSAIGTFVLQKLSTELKQMSTSNYHEKLKKFFNKEILKEFHISQKEKNSVDAQFDNNIYYNVNISDNLLKLVEKEKFKLKMESIFTNVKDTIQKFKKPIEDSSVAPKL